jgi:hypothetical protein
MQCYLHRDEEAVAVCSQCHRAICRKCLKNEGGMFFCTDHNKRTYSILFTKYYIMAIDLAREAAAKGVKTSELIEQLEREVT